MADEKCEFCGLPTTDWNREVRVQVVYDGLKGNFIQKRAGAKLFTHRVCDLPDQLEYRIQQESRMREGRG